MTAVADPTVRRRYVDTRFGQMHFAECGSGEPVVLLHQTPRSSREYAGVLPLIGCKVRAVAIDTLGFGQSADVDEAFSIEMFADAVIAVLDALGIATASLVGHHTGAVVALEVAARAPDRVSSLVLSAMPFVDAARRRIVGARPPIDLVEPAADGTHLATLWQRRRPFYKNGEEQFLACYVADALGVIDRVEEGHAAVNRYRMEDRLPTIRARCLLLCGAEDSYSMPDQPRLGRAMGCRIEVIAGGGVPLPEQRPAAFAEQVLSFVLAS